MRNASVIRPPMVPRRPRAIACVAASAGPVHDSSLNDAAYEAALRLGEAWFTWIICAAAALWASVAAVLGFGASAAWLAAPLAPLAPLLAAIAVAALLPLPAR